MPLFLTDKYKPDKLDEKMWQKEERLPLRNKDIPTSTSSPLAIVLPLRLIKKYGCVVFHFLNSTFDSPSSLPLIPEEQCIFLLGEGKFLKNFIICLASIIHHTLEFPATLCTASPHSFSPLPDNGFFSPYSALSAQDSQDFYHYPKS